MVSVDDEEGYLREHVRYEYWMLKQCLEKLNVCQDAVVFNALLESAAVHSRNLYYFLRNEGDRNNMKASNYCDYKARDTDKVSGSVRRLNSGIVHMGDKRSGGEEAKFSVSDAKNMYEWVDEKMHEFMKKVGGGYDEFFSAPDSSSNSVTQVTTTSTPTSSSNPQMLQEISNTKDKK